MCFVTVTPVILNVAIEKIPNIQKKRSPPFEKAYEKYSNGFYKNGIPSWLITQASEPNVHGMNVIIGSNTKYPQSPYNP